MKHFLIFCLIFIFAELYSQVKLNVVAKTGLFLRDKADKNGKILTQVPYGSSVDVIKKDRKFTFDNINGNWVFVEYNKLKGYIFSGYLSDLPAPIINSSIKDYFIKQIKVEKVISSNFIIYNETNHYTNASYVTVLFGYDIVQDYVDAGIKEGEYEAGLYYSTYLFKKRKIEEVFVVLKALGFCKYIDYFPISTINFPQKDKERYLIDKIQVKRKSNRIEEIKVIDYPMSGHRVIQTLKVTNNNDVVYIWDEYGD